jgi:hypothetical protein
MLMAIAGCDSSTEPVPAELAGNYDLAAVNGEALPVRIAQTSSGNVFVTAGLLQLRADGGFSQALRLETQVATGGSRVDVNEVEGGFTVRGNSLELRPRLGSTIQATVAGGTISYTVSGSEGGAQFTFRK